ncbi:MAG: hypothetical protein IJT00_06305, partial [Lachnospiraceae bacterium]|nr:hypothetical protein [Lachnospiraceae bacterium]
MPGVMGVPGEEPMPGVIGAPCGKAAPRVMKHLAGNVAPGNEVWGIERLERSRIKEEKKMTVNKMFRRILPAMLSAAMIFTSVPQYALAGYSKQTVQGQAEAAAEADAVYEDAQTGVTDTAASEQAAKAPGDADSADARAAKGSSSDADAAAGVSSVDPDETAVLDAAASAASSAEPADIAAADALDAAGAVVPIRIDVDLDKLKKAVASNDDADDPLRYVDFVDGVFVTDYEWAHSPAGHEGSDACVCLYKAVQKVGALSVTESPDGGARTYTLDENDNWAWDAYTNAVWTKEDGTSLAAGETPVLPGTYRLRFQLPADEVHGAAENSDIIFRVDKTRISVMNDNETMFTEAEAGSSYEDFIKKNAGFALTTRRYSYILKGSIDPDVPDRDNLL